MTRQAMKANSNNKVNPNQNLCAKAVVATFGLDKAVRYLHTYSDVKRAIGTRYSVRSRKSKLKSQTVGGAKAQIQAMMKAEGAIGAVIMVDGHVLAYKALFNGKIQTVDTDPRQRDARKIKAVHLIMRKGGL